MEVSDKDFCLLKIADIIWKRFAFTSKSDPQLCFHILWSRSLFQSRNFNIYLQFNGRFSDFNILLAMGVTFNKYALNVVFLKHKY